MNTKIARIFNTYGPRMRADDGRVVPAFISQALSGRNLTVFGDGSQTRSFCFVSDTVDGLVRLMMSDFEGPVNIGNPEEMTIREFAGFVLKRIRTKSSIDNRDLPIDDPKIRTGYIPGERKTWLETCRLPGNRSGYYNRVLPEDRGSNRNFQTG